MPIVKTDDIIKIENFSALILGLPGKGKTTLALSASKPLIIDADDGLGRVQSQYRPDDVIPLKKFSELLADLNPVTLAPYDTIIIDTLGKLIEKIIEYLGELDPKNLRPNGQPTIMGWGNVKETFKQLNKEVKSLGKDIIYVAHISEEDDDGKKVYRIDVGGSAKKEIYKDLDFAGFLEVYGKDLIINWAPSERFYSKNSLGIVDPEIIPNLTNGGPNTYMADLFNRKRAKEVEDSIVREKYKATKEAINSIIDGITDAESANAAVEGLKSLENVYCSKDEGRILLKKKVDEIRVSYNPESKKFERVPGADDA